MDDATPTDSKLTSTTLWLMTVGSGLVVANNYYNQPLLGKIAAAFDTTETQAGYIAMFTQLGYAAGLFLLVPLGDMLPRKRLIVFDFVFIIVALLAAALSTSIVQLILISFFIGLTSVVPQLFVPMAAFLAHPARRGKAIGTVMSGLLLGILCSRTLSGFVGEQFGWRAMYYIAAGLMALLWGAVLWLLPEVAPTYRGGYGSLLRSMTQFVKTQPALRLAALRGGLAFGSFSAFWTTLAFLMEGPPFFQGSDTVGVFGLIGAAGALSASVVGKLTDSLDKRKLIGLSFLVITVSWGLLYGLSATYWGLVLGVLLLDVGVQSAHITNQSIVFSLVPSAQNRLNTVYMVTYFLGGALGTWLASLGWQHAGWAGVSGVGLMFALGGGALYAFEKRQARQAVPDPGEYAA
ncbi:Predicted arabinose efflux permease, MFS family [Catalinimonas alkaloidigena]|uniref:Predicted arabinose efflux permease, MFS family n=1 Tax=Catalinimonas alkaloidigena TaxID=1075417 RepID=A0A1G9KFG0_9BACT|nr:MFS transporter [Catalinimonas alkaloidigena]SDL48244.1 Predicted arabinose efflux permease, MFS family [Catalinimonas alkaloidigena]